MLAIVEGSALTAQPDSVEAANIRELRRSYDRRVRLPRALVEELARTTSMAQSEWVACAGRERLRDASGPGWRRSSGSSGRNPPAWLARTRPMAAPGPAGSAYDPLLDEYEPGARSADLAVLFDALRRELTPLVAAIGEASARRARPGRAPARIFRPPTARRSSSDPTRAIGSGSSARPWPRRWASTSVAGGWT